MCAFDINEILEISGIKVGLMTFASFVEFLLDFSRFRHFISNEAVYIKYL